MAITLVLNCLTYADSDEIRSLFEKLTDHRAGERFRLVPPSYTDCGKTYASGPAHPGGRKSGEGHSIEGE